MGAISLKITTVEVNYNYIISITEIHDNLPDCKITLIR